MIVSFRHKGLRDFWLTDSKKGIPQLSPRASSAFSMRLTPPEMWGNSISPVTTCTS